MKRGTPEKDRIPSPHKHEKWHPKRLFRILGFESVTCCLNKNKKLDFSDFPGGQSSGKESIYQYREHKFDPWYRKIPHATGKLSLCATTTEPVSCTYWASELQLLKRTSSWASALEQDKTLKWETRAPQIEGNLLLPQLKKAHVQQQRLSTAKINK